MPMPFVWNVTCSLLLLAVAAYAPLATASAAVDEQQQYQQQNPSFVSSVTGSRLQWPTLYSANSVSNSTLPLFVASRHLKRNSIGEFDALNQLFDGATVAIPGEFSADAGSGLFIKRTLRIADIQCSNLEIADLIVVASSSDDILASGGPTTSNNNLPTVTVLDLAIVDLDFDCRMDYFLDKLVDDISGSITIQSRNNDVSTQFILESSTTAPKMITAALGERCSANLNIKDLDFSQDSVVGWLLNAADRLIRGKVADALSVVVCQEMESLAASTLPELLNQVTDSMDPYLQELEAAQKDPLRDEELMRVQVAAEEQPQFLAGASQYIDFQNASSSNHKAADMAHFILDTIDQVDTWLGSTVGTAKDGDTDLGINVFLRELLLDDNGAFVWDMTSSSFSPLFNSRPQHGGGRIEPPSEPMDPPTTTVGSGQGMVLLESHDELLDMKVTLESIEIRGLDSMTRLDTFDRIGKHTLQNTLAWKYLSGTAELSIRIAPSTLEDSLWSETRPGMEVLENVELRLSAEDVHAVVSFFMAIDQDDLGQVPLGALFRSDSIASCLFSTIYQGNLLSGFNVTVSNLIDPAMNYFSSPGLDRVLTEAMDLLYNLYEHWMIDAMPNFAQTTVRDSINDMWWDVIGGSQPDQAQACLLVDLLVQGDGNTSYLDFRDLLLPSDEALAMGAAGKEPYGDFVSFVFELIQEQLMVVDESDPDMRLRLNSMALAPLTKAQSGEEGTLNFKSNIASFVLDNKKNSVASNSTMLSEIASELFAYLEFRLYDTKVRNIDTVVAPSYLLQTSDIPFLLENLLKFGPVREKPLNASVRVLLAVDKDSDAAMNRTPAASLSSTVEHILDISLSTTSLEVVADVISMVDARKLQSFPLEDISNPYCWLATIPAPSLSKEGKVLPFDDVTGRLGVKLHAFMADFMNLALDVQCVNDACSNGGLGVLTELKGIWETSNVTTTLGERFELFAAELLTGDYADDQIGRWLDEAAHQCPHSEKSDTPATAYPPLGLPVFSSQSTDTIVFTALTAAQAGLLVLSEASLGASPGSTSAPADLANTSKRLIDFTDTDGIGTMADLISYVFSQANTLLGADESAAINDKTQLGINGIVSDMLDKSGTLELRFQDTTIIEQSNLKLRLNALRVVGLDTFTRFKILDAVSPQMLQNSIAMDRLAAEIDISILSGPDQTSNVQRIVLNLAAEDIEASLPIVAAIDEDKLNSLELGSLLEINTMLPCIFTAVEEMNVDMVELVIGKFTDISAKGMFPASNDAFARSMSAITERFGVGIDGFLNPVIQATLNGVFSYYKKNAKCENIMLSPEISRRRAEESPSSHIDFRDLLLSEAGSIESGGSGMSPYGNLFRSVLSFVQDLVLKVDPVSGLSSVNEKLIAPLTKSLSGLPGSIMMSDTIVDVVNRVRIGGLDALVTFRASDARIENLDTMGFPLSLLTPVAKEPHLLNNTATLGLVDERPLRLSLRLLLGLEDDDTQLWNDVELGVDLEAATMVLTALIKIVEDQFATFPLGDILNQDCWLAKIPSPPLDAYGFREEGIEPSAGIAQLAASVSRMNFDIKCFNCTSPGLKDFSTEGSQDIEAVMNRVINYLTNLLGGKFLQLQIDRALNNAAKRCPHSPEYDPNFVVPRYSTFESSHEPSMTFLLMILIVTAVLVVVLALIVTFVRFFVRTRHRRLLRSLPDKELYLLQKEQQKGDKRQTELNAVTSSLFQSSASIPAYVRYLIPIVILANIGFFLSGHLSLGATVNIEAQVAGESFQVKGFFSFSMAQSTIDIWNAGGKALASMIFIFSGLWPYTKQIITLVLWFTPPSKVSMATRGSTLVWLDTLAKWSMIDIFVLLVSIAGFRISIASPGVDFLPDNFYSVELLVVPMWGLYANMIAQIISQVSSHFIIHYHRQVEGKAARARSALFRKTARFLESDEQNSADSFVDEQRESSSLSSSSTTSDDANSARTNSARKDQLYQHAFVRPHSDKKQLVARGYVSPILIFCAVALAALLIAGCILPSFSLEIMGIMGVLVESGNQWTQAVEEHSVFTIIEMLMDQAEFLGGAGDYIGLGTLSALLLFTVLLVPLIQTLALLYHWFAPMTKEKRRKMEIFLEATRAWQYVEVYLIATVVASWQLGAISEFMINSYCGSLDATFAMLVYYGVLKESDAQCFRVEASISSASYMLAASAILLALLNTYIGNASRQYFRDVEKKSKDAVVPSVRAIVATATKVDNSSSAATGAFTVATAVSLDNSNSAATGATGAYFAKPSRPNLESLESPGNRVYGDDLWKNEEEGSLHETDPLAQPAVYEDDRWRRSEAVAKIHPVPVLFTDKFRWTLKSQDDVIALASRSVSKEVPSFLDDDTESSVSEAQSLLMMKGDAPEAIPSPTPSGDESTQGDEEFEDEIVATKMSLDNGKWSAEAVKGDANDRSVDDTERSDVETVGMMDQSMSSCASDFATARDEDDASMLLGAGSVRLEPIQQTNDESFEDEITDADEQEAIVLEEQSKPKPSKKPQGNSLLQAAFLEDQDENDLPSVS